MIQLYNSLVQVIKHIHHLVWNSRRIITNTKIISHSAHFKIDLSMRSHNHQSLQTLNIFWESRMKQVLILFIALALQIRWMSKKVLDLFRVISMFSSKTKSHNRSIVIHDLANRKSNNSHSVHLPVSGVDRNSKKGRQRTLSIFIYTSNKRIKKISLIRKHWFYKRQVVYQLMLCQQDKELTFRYIQQRGPASIRIWVKGNSTMLLMEFLLRRRRRWKKWSNAPVLSYKLQVPSLNHFTNTKRKKSLL